MAGVSHSVGWGRGLLALCACTLAGIGGPADAQAPTLEQYAEALAEQRLSAPPARDLDELEALLERAQRARLAQRPDAAARLLLRITDGPRFADFRDFDAYQNAEYTLAGVLLELRAAASARRYLERLLARGPDGPYFAPAFRRAVDAALDLDIPADYLTELAEHAEASDSEDVRGELAYLRGRAHFLAGETRAARTALAQVTERSRFYGSAQYLLGAMAALHEKYAAAEERFCAVAEAGKDHPYSVFADGRFQAVRDLSHLGLGRVTHEVGRADDAFYYYFQVPEDSARLDEALFEAAYASYEGGDYDVALDALDQLEAKTPHSPRVAEAALLRGFVQLSRCQFGEAEAELVAFQRTFGPMRDEVEAILESPARQRGLYDALARRERDLERIAAEGEVREPSPNGLLLTLLRVDPEFRQLHARLRALREESARVGALPSELEALADAIAEGKAPARASAERAEAEASTRRELVRRLADLRQGVGALGALLGQLARAGAPANERRALRAEIRAMDAEVVALERALEAMPASDGSTRQGSGSSLVALLRADAAQARRMARESRALQAELRDRADALALAALQRLQQDLAAQLRRARLGRIDAVMGSKRRLELQVESLAAGRFPPELADPMRTQTLLRDDEEYWPFEGEDWPDEFVERYPDEEGGE